MLNKVIDSIMEVMHYLLGSLFWRVDRAKRRRTKKKQGFTFLKRTPTRGITVKGDRGVARKWK